MRSGMPVGRLDGGAHPGERRRYALHRARASDSSPVSWKLPSCPRAARGGARVPALPQSIVALRRLAARPRRGDVAALPNLHAERADCGDRRLGVGRATEAPDHLSPSATAEQNRTVRDRLVPDGDAALTDDAASIFIRPGRRRRTRRSPAPEQRRRAPPGPHLTSIVRTPPRSGEKWRSSKSSMFIRSAPSACVMPARTPGRSGTETVTRWSSPGSPYASASIRRRFSDASAIQRASEPPSLPGHTRLAP